MKESPHRPTKAVIDLAAIAFNVKQIAQHIPQATLKYAVVKANAYGHGAVEVAHYLSPLVDGFCVSNLDEALELREAGISQKILILGVVDPSALSLAKKFDLSITVASLEWLDQALRIYPKLSGLVVHLKVDSGMGRIGFRQVKEIEEAQRLLEEAGADVEGIFTHFATADEKNQDKFQQQLSRFQDILSHLYQTPRLVHASNSATTLWHADTIMNAVRLGDALYGLNPSGQVLELPYEIRPALTLETELVHEKELEAGESVGYGATYETKEKQFIGTLPIGYADGWTRDMQDFHVLVEGQRCPIVGRISMDQTTIGLPQDYPLGTKVTLIGESGDLAITTTDVAEYRSTINYEVVCLLSDRIPRVYKK